MPDAGVLPDSADIVVMGGGLAGSLAAWRLARAGKRVVILRRGHAATAASSGALDLVVDRESTPESPLPRQSDLEVLLARDITADPEHLFSYLSDPAATPAQRAGWLLTVFSLARKSLEEMTGIGFKGDGRTVQVAISHAGTLKQTALVQDSIAISDPEFLKRRRIGFCGIRGVPGWDGERAALVYSHVMSTYAPPKVRGFNIELPEGTGYNSSAVGLATLLDNDDYFDRFIEKVRIGIGSNSYDLLLLPPVFGFQGPGQRVKRASEKLNTIVGETVSAAPSVPGLRLQTAMEKALSGSGARIVSCDITGANAGNGKIGHIRYRIVPDAPERSIEGKSFILATGKYFGGGIVRSRSLREPVFGLPVFLDGRIAHARQPEELFSRNAAGPHPAFRAGIRPGRDLRPMSNVNQPVYENLFACGNILAGYDYLRGGTGLGAALITGYLASDQMIGEGQSHRGR